MMQENESQQDTDKHLLDILSVGAVIPIIAHNAYGLAKWGIIPTKAQ